MATTAAVSLPQQIPHMPIPHVPRVRPPRILKGTPSPNSVPQPPGLVPSGKVWSQGQWRDPSSKSAKASRHHQSQQVEKALRHETHGQNIYAYANIRTHQVVYSLTKVMNNNKILHQLIYHGKKTVPAALRRDLWAPYFSLHFPPDAHGTASGLLAYHQLREFSKQRQLAPPEDMIITAQEDIDRIKARYNPVDLDRALENKKLKLPQVGQLLPKELRARKLMSQKKTAVADVAFVLGLQSEGPEPEEATRLREERRKQWWDNISRGAKARARKRERLRDGREVQLEARRRMITKADGGVGLNADAATRIEMQYQGVLAVKEGQVALMDGKADESEVEALIEDYMDRKRDQLPSASTTTKIIKAAKATTKGTEDKSKLSAAPQAITQRPNDPKEVRILWADLRDAAYAADWPETVVHAELERMAITKSRFEIPDNPNKVAVATSCSVHVIGGHKGSGWYLDPDELEELAKNRQSQENMRAVAEKNRRDKDDISRQKAAEALRETGIEVEMPRRGVWARVKGLVGR